ARLLSPPWATHDHATPAASTRRGADLAWSLHAIAPEKQENSAAPGLLTSVSKGEWIMRCRLLGRLLILALIVSQAHDYGSSALITRSGVIGSVGDVLCVLVGPGLFIHAARKEASAKELPLPPATHDPSSVQFVPHADPGAGGVRLSVRF